MVMERTTVTVTVTCMPIPGVGANGQQKSGDTQRHPRSAWLQDISNTSYISNRDLYFGRRSTPGIAPEMIQNLPLSSIAATTVVS